jgi:hypothetical protein
VSGAQHDDPDRSKRIGSQGDAEQSSASGRGTGSGTSGEAQPGARLPESFRAEYEAAQTVDARDQVVDRYFDVEPVRSDQDIRPDTLYYARDKKRHLVRTFPAESHSDLLPLTFALSGRRTKPVPRQKLLELGRRARLVRLVPKTKAEAGLPSSCPATDPDSDQDSDSDGSEAPIDVRQLHPETSIDMGTLTQLLTVARQSGLIPTADQIAHVRDCEFRMGKYQRAFDIIERMWVKFNQSVSQRRQKLRAEELRYRSGVLKMTPKQWQQKKQRDTAQTLNIERARRKFARVLDALRFLSREE